MEISSILPLIHNAALLLAIIFIYDLVTSHGKTEYLPHRQIPAGIAVGLTGLVIMLTPWEFAPGMYFDMRSVLLCISGLFLGTVPTLIAMLMTASLRYHLGGTFFTGIIVILASGCIGIAWRHFRHERVDNLSLKELYLFGFAVHLIMLALMFTLPWDEALNLVANMAVPFLLIYPVATTLMGAVFLKRLERMRIAKALEESEFLLRAQFDLGNTGMAITSAAGKWLRINPRLGEMLGYSEAELSNLNWRKVIHRDSLTPTSQQMQRMLDGEIGQFEADVCFLHKAGHPVYTHLTASCYRSDEGVQFIIMGILDMSTRHRAELALRASEEQLSLALEGGDLDFWDWDIQQDRIQHNIRWSERLQHSATGTQHSMKQWLQAIHPADREAVQQSIDAQLEGKSERLKMEYRILTDTGAYRWLLDSAKVVTRDDKGQALRMCGTHADISERKQSEQSMRLASMVYENSSEAMAVMDPNGIVISVNPAFTEVTGRSIQESIGTNFNNYRTELQDAKFYAALDRAVAETGHWQGEIRARRKTGEEFVAWLCINTITNSEGQPHRRVALFSDISDKKRTEEIIWNQANFDPLTGLPNRSMFLNELKREITKAARYNRSLVLMFLDLDLFKEVNDALGHDAGDMLLKEATQRLRECVRESDIVSRLGGDEFTVVLNEVDDPGVIERIADKILKKMAEPFHLDPETTYISTSIGITRYPQDASDVEALLKSADQAMYAAKEQGRNRFSYFMPSMQEAARTRIRLISDLRDAIAEQQFELYYQPIVELATGVVQKAEALLRWHHPKNGLVPPLQFIPLAEETGMIVEIGNWVFHEAVRQAAAWRDQYGREIQISINKSPIQFRERPEMLAQWFEHMRQLGLSGHSIAIEITEGLLLDASPSVSDKLLAFRDHGIQVSIDDFGTGYSSLSYLKKFDIDYIKIDRTFVRNLEHDSDDMVVCDAIISMTHKLGMQVIAEGVETKKQRDLLTIAGCDYGQGYLFSKPVPAAEFAAMFL